VDKQRLIEQRILAQHRVVAQRLRANPDDVLAHARTNLARWQDGDVDPPEYLREWTALLAGPVERIETVLTADTDEAKRLRSSSPFAGIVSARERWSIYRDLHDDAE
jgi:hypothetical protein